MAIKKGDIIKVHYTGTFNDGTVFDSSETQGRPMKFEVGARQLIEGFDSSVLGKEVGDEYSIMLEPTKAYGEYNESLTEQVPKTQFPKEPKPQVGMMLQLMGPDGHSATATIKNISEEIITIDLNHPMAGKTLNFKIKIVETGCELDQPSACGCGCETEPSSACGCGCEHEHK